MLRNQELDPWLRAHSAPALGRLGAGAPADFKASDVEELIVALETAGADDAVRVIVLTGAGGVFCSGGDLSQMSGGGGGDGDDAIPFRGGFVELNLAFRAVRKPIIAKIRRYALAGGLGLMCACTFALAEESATFGTPEIKRGLFPMMIMASIRYHQLAIRAW